MRDYDKLLTTGTTAQLEKLRENEHKRGFENIDIDYAFLRLNEEFMELYREMIMPDRDYSAVRREAADVANFAHMIILACEKHFA